MARRAPQKPLRLRPGVLIAAAFVLVRFVVSPIIPDGDLIGMVAAMVAALAILVWWLAFSRAAWIERLGAIVVMIAAVALAWRIVDKSIATGMMGAMLPAYAIPAMSVGLVAWAVAAARLPTPLRRASMVVVLLLAAFSLALLRTGGIGGGKLSDLHWRWTPTPEERLMAREAREPALVAPKVAPAEALKPFPAPVAGAPPSPAPTPARKTNDEGAEVTPPALPQKVAEWPGFRGADRNGVVRGVRLETDWAKFPPVALWRRPIGPGWSSFAVDGDLLFTQEQPGDDELVSAYRVSTGEPVWRHRDPARFWESNGGAGLKPYYDDFVVHNGYAFGADGSILACIDLADGTRKWKGGRYGGAQILLLPGQDLLLVLSEEGELALVSATPDQFKQIARIPVLEGKTWNHPVIVRDLLLVRNGEEMAAFRLPVVSR